jgi:hypothetical protein
MLSDQKTPLSLFDKFLDVFFHLPTLVTIALVSVVILWQICDAGFHMGHGFVRLNTNQGNITLDWLGGCCDLDW